MILEWFVGFHPRHLGSWQGIFGHVEIWGYTVDDTWLFLDPQGRGTRIDVTHLYDEVTVKIAARIELCETILRVQPTDRTLFPLHGSMTCASIVGHMLGIRALTPAGLKRRLLALGAEIIHDPKGRSSGPRGAHQGAPRIQP